MNSNLNFVIIIIIFVIHSNAYPINEYYLDEICDTKGESSQSKTLRPDISAPIKLYFSRSKPTHFAKSYCMVYVQVVEHQSIWVAGHLGQLLLNQSKSNSKRLHFEFSPNLNENHAIDEKFFARQLIIVVENNDNSVVDNSMNTELTIKAFSEDEDCEESLSPKCLNTEEEQYDSSGEAPICSDNNCGNELLDECDDQNNCTNKSVNEINVMTEDDKSEAPTVESVRTSGSNTISKNNLVIVCTSILFLIVSKLVSIN